jgi:hypothetical protein
VQVSWHCVDGAGVRLLLGEGVCVGVALELAAVLFDADPLGELDGVELCDGVADALGTGVALAVTLDEDEADGGVVAL